MEIKNALSEISSKAAKLKDSITTEEATKNALVMPFIRALGYDVFNPNEVVPEYTADVLSRKGEKVDYAIMHEEKPTILIECKTCGSQIDIKQANQLYRYFTATDAKIAILTDGIVYKFFSDLDDHNKMDEKPFLVLNLLDIEDGVISEVSKIAKSTFDLDSALAAANDLKYSREIKIIFEQEAETPSDEFVRVFAKRVYQGKLTQSTLEYFRDIVKKSFKNYVNDVIKNKFSSVINDNKDDFNQNDNTDQKATDGIITTEEELEGYRIVLAILAEICPPERVFMRDLKGFCNILLDDTQRKPLCRLYFNDNNLCIGIFDHNKKVTKIEIGKPLDIYKHAAEIKQTFKNYEDI